jgi:prepilin-type N-terminal cleavage/methylation domain-containing protein
MGRDPRRNDTGALRKTDGFSLVELMVVLVVLAVGLLPLAFVQTRSQQNVVDSGRYSQAMELAQLQLEAARSRGYGNVQAANGTAGSYAWNSTVQNVSFGLDQVTVQVTWRERGNPRTVTVIDMMSLR